MIVAPMLARVTRGDGAMVRDVSSFIDETGEIRLIPDFRDRVLGRKSPREAKEGETRGSLDLPGSPLARWRRGRQARYLVYSQGDKPTSTNRAPVLRRARVQVGSPIGAPIVADVERLEAAIGATASVLSFESVPAHAVTSLVALK